MGTIVDLNGQRFGKLTVLRRDTDTGKPGVHWVCACDCGTVRSLPAASICDGQKSCGCLKPKKKDMTGERFGRLLVVKPSDRQKPRERGKAVSSAYWECVCDCGKTVHITRERLKNGKESCSATCKSREKLVGKSFGDLTVISFEKTDNIGNLVWRVKCSCGNELFATTNALNSYKKDCGCKARVASYDYSGKSIGKLKILHRSSNADFWECVCACGAHVTVSDAVAAAAPSGVDCGCGRTELLGRRYGNLVIGQSKLSTIRSVNDWFSCKYICVCDCGGSFATTKNRLLKGIDLSCGCASKNQEIVYVVSAGQFVKIGYSSNFQHRYSAIQTGSPVDIDVLCLLPNGAVNKEREIHRILTQYHSHGEWLHSSPDIVSAALSAKSTDEFMYMLGALQ